MKYNLKKKKKNGALNYHIQNNSARVQPRWVWLQSPDFSE